MPSVYRSNSNGRILQDVNLPLPTLVFCLEKIVLPSRPLSHERTLTSRLEKQASTFLESADPSYRPTSSCHRPNSGSKNHGNKNTMICSVGDAGVRYHCLAHGMWPTQSPDYSEPPHLRKSRIARCQHRGRSCAHDVNGGGYALLLLPSTPRLFSGITGSWVDFLLPIMEGKLSLCVGVRVSAWLPFHSALQTREKSSVSAVSLFHFLQPYCRFV